MSLGKRWLLLWVAFLFHVPGLAVLGRVDLASGLARPNAWAIALTLVAMVLAFFTLAASARMAGVLLAWAVGHLLWGLLLSLCVRRRLASRA